MATQLQSGKFVVTSGPSREELFDALRLVVENRRIVLRYLFEGKEQNLVFQVTGIEVDRDSPGFVWMVRGLTDHGRTRSRVVFNTRERTGLLEFAEESR